MTAYIGRTLWLAAYATESYAIDFGPANFRNAEAPLTIAEDLESTKFSHYTVEEHSPATLAGLAGSPLTFTFRPKNFPGLGKRVRASAIIRDRGDWEISLDCTTCPKEERYDWQSFCHGWLSDYAVIADFGETVVYGLDAARSWQDAPTPEAWAEANFHDIRRLTVIDEALPVASLLDMAVDFAPGQSTTIHHELRGAHTFHAYLQDRLEMTVIKKDLNWATGDDGVRVTVTTLDGKEIYSDIISDDGIADRLPGDALAVRKTVSAKLPARGAYRITLVPITPGNNDWLLTSLSINTNKIVLTGDSLIMDPSDLYAEITAPTDIGLYVWHATAMQEMRFRGTGHEVKINIGPDELGQVQTVTLPPDTYTFHLNGDQIVKGGTTSFAFSQDQYFNVAAFDRLPGAAPADVVVSRHRFERLDGGWLAVSAPLDLSRLGDGQDLRSLDFKIKNDELYRDYLTGQGFYERGYSLIATAGDRQLFGQDRPVGIIPATGPASDAEWLATFADDGSTVVIQDNKYKEEKAYRLATDGIGTSLVPIIEALEFPDFFIGPDLYAPAAAIREVGITVTRD
jgi:hypothetical protein